MKLYMHPVSTTSRPVRLLIAEHGLAVEEKVVDLMTGEHMQPPYAEINPNKLVPTLEHGGFRLTESSAIMKYLADHFGLERVYPKQLEARARVNERMDWFNTNLYRDLGYGLCYPQVFPHHRRPNAETQAGTLEWARGKTNVWLSVLDRHLIGSNPYVCGKDLTIADYFGVCLLTFGEVLRLDFSKYPNVQRWVAKMKELESWPKLNESLYGFKDAVAQQTFVGL
jgi:glutathione S-transferase